MALGLRQVGPDGAPGGKGFGDARGIARAVAIGEADQPVVVGRRGDRVRDWPLLDHRHADAGLDQPPGRRQPDDPSADD